MLLNLRIEGIYVEVQIGIAALVAVRRSMHKYYGVVRSTGTSSLIAMAKPLREADVGAELMAVVKATCEREAAWVEAIAACTRHTVRRK